ncbi:hypothetical protein M404DRAFT_35662 [Pisolithus tinctorius Marx 270]|uniref:Uncharacterized protein n=1 Tax=Pisolithus tinctorius Marx 270 TaxID=870435 RepID=A0A0C3NDL0_PISTI|nr:hypothetical protein M404DRAFT_35662 [Pisolithus tinctorius Marx 270]
MSDTASEGEDAEDEVEQWSNGPRAATPFPRPMAVRTRPAVEHQQATHKSRKNTPLPVTLVTASRGPNADQDEEGQSEGKAWDSVDDTEELPVLAHRNRDIIGQIKDCSANQGDDSLHGLPLAKNASTVPDRCQLKSADGRLRPSLKTSRGPQATKNPSAHVATAAPKSGPSCTTQKGTTDSKSSKGMPAKTLGDGMGDAIWKSPRVRKAPAWPDANVLSPPSKKSWKHKSAASPGPAGKRRRIQGDNPGTAHPSQNDRSRRRHQRPASYSEKTVQDPVPPPPPPSAAAYSKDHLVPPPPPPFETAFPMEELLPPPPPPSDTAEVAAKPEEVPPPPPPAEDIEDKDTDRPPPPPSSDDDESADDLTPPPPPSSEDCRHDLSDEEKTQMEMDGFVHPGADIAVYWEIHRLRLDRRPVWYHFPFVLHEWHDRAIADGMSRMATEFAYLVAHRMDLLEEGDRPPTLCRTAVKSRTKLVRHLTQLPSTAHWPEDWYQHLCIDMGTLDCLIPIVVTQNCYRPPLPTTYILHHMGRWTEATFCDAWFQIPEVQITDFTYSIIELLPQWSPRPDTDGGFMLPWWLNGISNYASKAQVLHSNEVQTITQRYFTDLWPLQKFPIKDRLHGVLDTQVKRYKNNALRVEALLPGLTAEVEELFERLNCMAQMLGRYHEPNACIDFS